MRVGRVIQVVLAVLGAFFALVVVVGLVRDRVDPAENKVALAKPLSPPKVADVNAATAKVDRAAKDATTAAMRDYVAASWTKATGMKAEATGINKRSLFLHLPRCGDREVKDWVTILTRDKLLKLGFAIVECSDEKGQQALFNLLW